MIPLGYALLLTAIVTLAYLYYRTTIRLPRSRSVCDDVLGPTLRVTLDNFQPVLCNPSFASLLGYSNPTECIELFAEHLHLRGQSLHRLYLAVRETGRKVVTIDLIDRDGEVVASEIEVFIATGEDVMEIRLDSEDTAAYRPAASINVRQSLLPCIEVDRTLTIVACNEAARRLFGWYNTRVAGRRLGGAVFPRHLRERLESIYSRRLVSKGSLRLTHPTLIGQDEIGECRWEITLQPDIGRVYAFCQPRSDRVLTDSLKADLLGDTCFTWQVDVKAGTVINDPAWIEYLGYEDAIDTDRIAFWDNIVFREDKAGFRTSFLRLFDGIDASLHTEFRLTARSGVEHRVEARAVVHTFDADGKPRRVMGAHRVVPENARQLRGGNHTRHAIANQLASVTGYASLVSESEELPDPLVSYVQEIEQAGQKAHDLLQGNRIRDHGLIGLVEETARRHDIRAVHNERQLNAVTTDSMITRVLDLLCDNALQAGGNRANVYLETGRMEWLRLQRCASCEQPLEGGWCFIEIHDRGEGIPWDHLPWIFVPGFTTRGLGAGKGYGLTEADDRLHAIGGHIEVTSTQGEGSCFTLWLPELRHEAPTPIPTNNGKRQQLLIVDDEAAVARYLREIVTHAGYGATVFTDPREALESFRRNPSRYDLVITDQTMPGLSGDRLMHELLKIESALPVIICAAVDDTNVSTSRDSSARGYVSKPVDPMSLLALIAKSLTNVAIGQ